MNLLRTMASPVSPALPVRLALRPLPLLVLQPILNRMMEVVASRHPHLFDRLSFLENPVFLIDPVGIPFYFALIPDPAAPSLRAVLNPRAVAPTAAIRAPLPLLLDLLEGRLDGDALFFSRDLVIEGDTEAIVALRNAVDDAEIDLLDDALSVLGPFAMPAGRVAQAGRNFLKKVRRS